MIQLRIKRTSRRTGEKKQINATEQRSSLVKMITTPLPPSSTYSPFSSACSKFPSLCFSPQETFTCRHEQDMSAVTWVDHALVTGLTLDIRDLLNNVFVLGWQDLVASVSVLCASSVSCHLACCGQLPAGLRTDHLFSLSPETFMKSLQVPAMNVPRACSSIFCTPESARTILMKWSLNLDCRIPV